MTHRLISLETLIGCHFLPSRVVMSKRLSSSERERRESFPCCCSCLMVGRMVSAKALACFLCSSASFWPFFPSFTPLALAAARASLVRLLICSRSCSAKTASMRSIRRLAGVVHRHKFDYTLHRAHPQFVGRCGRAFLRVSNGNGWD